MDNVGHEAPASDRRSVGEDLVLAREAAGLSRADIASQTKIAERHLLAIEEGRFGDLAARTYAVGFTRAYARALGLDERQFAERVRRRLDEEGYAQHRTLEPSFEPGDPARIPSLRIVIWAAVGIVAALALVVVAKSSFLSPQGELPSLLPDETASHSAAPAPVKAAPVPQVTGPVVITALEQNIWLRVTDAAGAQLLQKTLAKGESWTVPADAQGPLLRTGRPDALQISVGGKVIPPLADHPMTVRDMSLLPASLLGLPPAAAPVVPAVGANLPSPAPSVRPTSVRAAAPSPAPAATPSAAPTRAPAPTPSPVRTITHAPTVAAPTAASRSPATAAPPPASSQAGGGDQPAAVSTVSD